MARRLGVTRDDVVQAAVRVADREGLEGLTVAAVAAEVGCRPPSVYHHVDGLDGLVRAVALVAASQLGQSLAVAERGRDGLEALRSMSRIGRSWARAHRGRFAAVCLPVSGELDPELAAARRELLAPARRALTGAGIAAEDHDRWLVALVAAVRGAAMVELDAEVGTAAHRDDAHELLIGLLLTHIGQDERAGTTAP